LAGTAPIPQKTKDPVLLAAEIIVALQTIVSRETRPGDPVVVTVGTIHGGTKNNIIPDEVKLQLNRAHLTAMNPANKRSRPSSASRMVAASRQDCRRN